MRLEVGVENLDEVGYDLLALECSEQATVHVNGGLRFFGRSRQRNAEAWVLRFAGAIDDAAHYGDFHFFYAGVAFLPDGHLLTQIGLDLLRHLLEERARSTAAAGAGGDLRGEAANAERLQNLLRHADFFGAIASRRGSERNADGVADAFLQQHSHRRARSDDAFLSHAGLGYSEMQRVLPPAPEHPIHTDQLLHPPAFPPHN